MSHYYSAKADADRHLLQAELDYAILMPGKLTDENGTGNVMLGEKIKERDGSISRTDVASVLEHLLGADNSHKKAIELLNGDTPLNKAVEQL